MSDWFETLEALHAEIWDSVVQGIGNSDHPTRTPTFATVSPKGWPEARTVVLRAVDTEYGTLAFYTDLFSDKIRSLQATPRAALHIWDAEKALQIRMSMHVKIASGDAVKSIWANLPEHSKLSYGVDPAPGQPIKQALNYSKTPDPAAFAVLNCEVLTIDAVHLGDDHRRAIYSRSDDWMGHWLSP
ncbi:pyridoxamine 5'-phosphate oxidase family protein [Yoonia sp. SS1-5]|uniref:Pyridoxamine 5'-phosphate oxidase family protein n=1 Tax=Yoonia rhodophyticola TaxID=3137370 RepID=A0AAN0NLM5_9RHOB